MTILLTGLAFILGSLPFAVWIGRLTTGQDIREVGDHNPGATNVLRAGSRAGFILAIILDISKGAFPVGLAYNILEIQDWQIIPIALAPILGHAFSPFLNWQGGKALATAFGVWIGFTVWPIPFIAISSLIVWRLLIKPSGWALLLSLICIGIALFIWWPDPIFLAVLAGQCVILLWKHREEFGERPVWRWRYRTKE